VPVDGVAESMRGGPLHERDEPTRVAIAELGDRVDPAVTEAWDAALAAPAWGGPPVVLHADLAPGNVLVLDGRLAAPIDWGCFGVGRGRVLTVALLQLPCYWDSNPGVAEQARRTIAAVLADQG
jgi:aminoglycoside phosphotransferase (APT) family kinase protein